jgi:hypothetical protein
MRVSCSSPASENARHTVAVEATGLGHRGQVPQALEVANRLTAQDLRHGAVDHELTSVIDRVESAPRPPSRSTTRFEGGVVPAWRVAVAEPVEEPIASDTERLPRAIVSARDEPVPGC